MKRIYEAALQEHVESLRHMAFLTGPRQVGKTTSCQTLADQGRYVNWDNQGHRAIILKGADEVASALKLHQLEQLKPVIVFDEIHKYSKWKNFLKGFFFLSRYSRAERPRLVARRAVEALAHAPAASVGPSRPSVPRLATRKSAAGKRPLVG